VHTFVTGLLLVVVLAFPITFVLVVAWVLRRHGMDTKHEPPDSIDYDKW
jgi:cbb3-type cytochrome oxidase subunit 3